MELTALDVKFCAAREKVDVQPAHAEDVTADQNMMRVSKAGQDCEISLDIRAAWKPKAGAEYRDVHGFAASCMLKKCT